MTAPAGPGTLVPVSDEVAAARLLAVQDDLADLLGEVAPGRERIIDAVLMALDTALGRLGYEPPPEWPDDDEWS